MPKDMDFEALPVHWGPCLEPTPKEIFLFPRSSSFIWAVLFSKGHNDLSAENQNQEDFEELITC